MLLVLGSLAGSQSAQAQMTATKWRNLSQYERDQAIANMALSYPTGYLFTKNGGECKEWVREVVLRASGGAVSIPANATSSTWAYSPYVASYRPQYPTRGDIIQMQWSTTLHTMIVLSSDSNGLNVIDCNWYNRDYYSRVYRHTIKWADFRANAKAYTVYGLLHQVDNNGEEQSSPFLYLS